MEKKCATSMEYFMAHPIGAGHVCLPACLYWYDKFGECAWHIKVEKCVSSARGGVICVSFRVSN